MQLLFFADFELIQDFWRFKILSEKRGILIKKKFNEEFIKIE